MNFPFRDLIRCVHVYIYIYILSCTCRSTAVRNSILGKAVGDVVCDDCSI